MQVKRQLAGHALVAVGDQAAANLGDSVVLAAHVQLLQVVDGDAGLGGSAQFAGIPGGDRISSANIATIYIDDMIKRKLTRVFLEGAPPGVL
jgi:hypothetical protein